MRQLVATYKPRRVTQHYGGVELTISIEDPLAEGWYLTAPKQVYPEIVAAREHRLSPGATAFDIGAHQAVVALIIADLVGSKGAVVAVEADRHNVRVARRNVELSGADHVTVVEAACTSHSGTVTFHEGLNGRILAGRTGNHLTRAVTIDELAGEHGMPDVVYLDIEGHEGAALRGAAKVLEAGATFVIEVHAEHQLQEAGGSVTQLADVLGEHGYRFAILRELEWEEGSPMREVEAAELPANERFFLLAHRPEPA